MLRERNQARRDSHFLLGRRTPIKACCGWCQRNHQHLLVNIERDLPVVYCHSQERLVQLRNFFQLVFKSFCASCAHLSRSAEDFSGRGMRNSYSRQCSCASQ